MLALTPLKSEAQINTERMMNIGRNALYFDDYVLSIQYFNMVISAKPYLHEPYFYRGLAKFYLDDYQGAREDCSKAIERNPFFPNSYQVRGLSLINTGAEDRLHDCRARNEIEAILWHGYSKKSDAYESALKFYKLPKSDRDAVVKFLRAI